MPSRRGYVQETWTKRHSLKTINSLSVPLPRHEGPLVHRGGPPRPLTTKRSRKFHL